MRRRFLVIAAAAVITALASPGVSSAAFSVRITDDLGGDVTMALPGGTLGTLGSPVSIFNGRWSVAVVASSNAPGGPTSSTIQNLTLDIHNNTQGPGNNASQITVRLIDDGFTFPAAGTVVDVETVISVQNGNGNNVGVSGFTTLNEGLAVNTPTQYAVANSANFYIGTQTTTLASALSSYGNAITFSGVQVGQRGYAQITSIVTPDAGNEGNANPTPAPAGLVLMAGAVPFLGLIRRRFRAAQTAA